MTDENHRKELGMYNAGEAGSKEKTLTHSLPQAVVAAGPGTGYLINLFFLLTSEIFKCRYYPDRWICEELGMWKSWG